MKPLILVSNDDGVLSPGLLALADALAPLGDVLVSAPRYQQTGMGRSYPRSDTLGIIEEFPAVIGGKEIMTYGVHGSPAFAVAFGVLELCDRKPDLCVCGINYGENLGLNLTCSGTLGAAMEADSHGIPALAVSRRVPFALQHVSDFPELDWEVEKAFTTRFVAALLEEGMGEGVSIWNLNFPEVTKPDTELRLTRQSWESAFHFRRPQRTDRTTPHRLSADFFLGEHLEPADDTYAVYIDEVVSATPLTWDCTVHGRELPGALR